MRKYVIQPLACELPELTGIVFEPENEPFCEAHDYAPIDSYVWDGTGYRPEARAYAAWDDEGLHVLLCAREKEICVRAAKYGDAVYKDSCLEFFFRPFADDPRYLNIETNAAGVALMEIGAERFGRTRLPEVPEGMNIRASRHRGEWWAVAYTVPKEMLKKLYGRVPAPGSTMLGNFYKCDESIHPHFGTWNPIVNFQPDFHRPEWFGELMLAEKAER